MGGFLSGFGSTFGGGNGPGKAKDAYKKHKEGARVAQKAMDSANSSTGASMPDVYHEGGTVRKTGLARLKKGELVLTKPQQRKLGIRKRMSGK